MVRRHEHQQCPLVRVRGYRSGQVLSVGLFRGDAERRVGNLGQRRQLHDMAQRQLRQSDDDETLDPTALVHEAYIKLVGSNAPSFSDRSGFFSYAATAMRSVVVDHARSRVALKRGGGEADARINELPELADEGLKLDEDVLSLDAALLQLEGLDEHLAKVVELRYFGGLSEPQIAEITGRSERTIRRDWQKARMFLLNQLQGQ